VKKMIALAAVGGLALAACGGDDEAGGPSVSGAWARTSPMGADIGAAYFELESDTDDTLVGASVSADIAATVEMHETVMSEGGMGEDMTEDSMTEDSMAGDSMTEGTMAEDESEDGGMDMGTMTMQQVAEIALPAGETVTLQPGGLHLMLIDLAEPLEIGDTFDLTLDFAEADDVTVSVEVRDEAP
jgi:copper(I)-binding protein